MKKLYSEEKYQKYKLAVAKNRARRRLKVAKKHLHNVLYGPRDGKGDKLSGEKLRDFNSAKFIKAPENFSIRENCEPVVRFFNKLESEFIKRHFVRIDLSELTKIDDEAITMFISVLFSAKIKKLKVLSSHPKNKEIDMDLQRSGFFAALQLNVLAGATRWVIDDHEVFTSVHTNYFQPKLMIPVIRAVAKKLPPYTRKKIPWLYSILGEMVDNTQKWASGTERKHERWWLIVSENKKQGEVRISFVDYGVGILERILSGEIWMVGKLLRKYDGEPAGRVEILQKMFNGEVSKKTSSGLPQRGKGLPSIKARVTSQQGISDSFVLTNDIFGNLIQDEYRLIDANFSGTLYSIVIDINSYGRTPSKD